MSTRKRPSTATGLAPVIPIESARPRAVVEESERPAVSEFYVHAVLQAARAYILGLDLGSAKSWGLNRAIFYEAAKKGYIGNFSRGRRSVTVGVLYSVGNERAYAVKERAGVRFVIGRAHSAPPLFFPAVS